MKDNHIDTSHLSEDDKDKQDKQDCEHSEHSHNSEHVNNGCASHDCLSSSPNISHACSHDSDSHACSHDSDSHACSHDHAAHAHFSSEQSASAIEPPKGAVQTKYHIQNMDCPMEESLIRKKFEGMNSIHALKFNLIKRVLTVYHNVDNIEIIEQTLSSIGMHPKMLIEGANDIIETKQVPWKRLVVACILALSAELVHFGSGSVFSETISWWLSLSMAIAAIGLGGLSTYKKGWIALKNFDLNMNALMSFAVTGAVLIGQFPEAAMVMVLFTIAEIIEDKSIGRARKAIQELLTLTPEQATVKREDGIWESVDSKTIAVGSIIRVRPGERIGLDGIVTSGASAINEAPITGESLPVDKNIGDNVYAGTINESSELEYKTTSLATNSTIARIIYAVEQAQQTKAPMQRFVDKFARIYTPIVFIMAIMIAVIPPIFFGAEWFEQVYKALVLLVIACPCALVISTPVSIVSALAAATKHGLLIKGGAFLEQGRKLKCIALDKTGTITNGLTTLTNIVNIAEDSEHDTLELAANLAHDMDIDDSFSSELVLHMLNDVVDTAKNKENESLKIAASLASHSDHPVSRAIVKSAKEKDIELFEVKDFKAILGQGISGKISSKIIDTDNDKIDGKVNDKIWYLGNSRLLKDVSDFSIQLQEMALPLEQEGKTVVFLIEDSDVIAIFAVADTIRESSIEAIRDLKAMGIKTVMLTGDNEHTAQTVAKQVGVDIVKHSLLPEDKLEAITELAKSGSVGMVGDGINDAPALAKADIGFAMASMGTDTAIETADIAIMDDDLRKVVKFISLSRSTFWILTQNIIIALGIKTIFVVLTLMGDATMWMAVFADIGTSFIVVANGLRLLNK